MAAAGRRVAYVAPSHTIANQTARLIMAAGAGAYVWQSQESLCTCHTPGLLGTLAVLGYAAPDCLPGCAYTQQYLEAEGAVVCYQHAHLTIKGGRLLDGCDVVIVDESINSTINLEKETPNDVVRRWLNTASKHDNAPLGPAVPILEALFRVGLEAEKGKIDLSRAALLEALQEELGDMPLESAIAAALETWLGQLTAPAPPTT